MLLYNAVQINNQKIKLVDSLIRNEKKRKNNFIITKNIEQDFNQTYIQSLKH